MKTQTGIAYAPPETPELLDVYQPDDSGKRAAVLMLHGGGWRVGSRSDLAPHAEALVRHGFTAVVADYRLMTDHPWPAQIRDVRAAIKWIRDNVDALGIEPDRISALGYSAGAHLAALAAGDPDGAAAKDSLGRVPLNAVVPCEPIIGFQAGQYERGYTPSWSLFGPDLVRPQDIRDASPMTFVRPDFPPSCFCHGAEDIQIPCTGSITMQQALSRVGAVSDLHLFSTYPHALWRVKSLIEPLVDIAVSFLDRTMVDPKPYAAELVDFWATLPPGSGQPMPAEYREPKIPGRSG
jgi:acetyl esterase/lipase